MKDIKCYTGECDYNEHGKCTLDEIEVYGGQCESYRCDILEDIDE